MTRWTARRILALAMAVSALGTSAILGGPPALVILLGESLLPAGILASAAGWGWPISLLVRRLSSEARMARDVVVAIAAGIGILGWILLALGVAGWLTTLVAWGLLIAGWCLLIAFLPTLTRDVRESANAAVRTRLDAILAIATGALVGASAGTMLFAATLPPGVLWRPEGGGYDALEYHLQAPREYYEAGRIHFLEHNVYASFPQQTEVFYLWLMHLLRDPHAAAIPAQLLHAGFVLLACVAAAAWQSGALAPRIALLAVWSAPLLVYVGCLAYVEGTLLLMTTVCAGQAIDALRANGAAQRRLSLLAGSFAGLACGVKYTALALVAAPVAMGLTAAVAITRRSPWRALALFGLGAGVAFAPWLIRNAALAGNPVYPFAYEWFGGRAWSGEQADQWHRGHAPGPWGERLPPAVRELSGDQFGWGAWILAALGAARLAAKRQSVEQLVFFGGWLALLLLSLVTFTQAPARFAIPVLALLAWLACGATSGEAGATTGERRLSLAAWLLAAVAAGWSGWTSLQRLAAEGRAWEARTGVALRQMPGMTQAMLDAHPVNRFTPADARVWLVGDAAVFYVLRPMRYTVVFNRDPWVEFAGRGADGAELAAWLRSRNYTHVVFSWPEVSRLGRTYGFPAHVTPEWAARRLAPPDFSRLSSAELPPGFDIYAVE